MKAKLEIIVTHWKEPWAVCSKFFDMLNVQRGMNAGECRVTLVQDGDEDRLDTGYLLKKYGFISSVIDIPHSGISAARNAGLDAAKADWVMFCDCDDMLYSGDSLRAILDAIAAIGNQADLLWGPFYIENRSREGIWSMTPEGWNNIFIHSKIWRAAWLKEKDIRFDERLDYSEDSLFCATAALELDPKRIRKINQTIYVWCLRGGSCTSDKGNEARNREHLARHRVYFPEICMARGHITEARTNALRGIYDSYYEMTGGTIPVHERWELEKIITRGLLVPWSEECAKIPKEEKTKIMSVSRESTVRKGMFSEECCTFREWVGKMLEKNREW